MSDKSSKPAQDDLQKKFREALEKKNANRHAHPGTGTRGEGVGDAHNDKQKRQFRRKSGS
ncbi:hypothetical protein EV646_10445 [Kribbella antiqua]|jgi:adenylosuccinate synthase|uniref:DUF5302 domain-containing protein n=1 Tax=Kribbella antiqua TaxID=2512217 RepID=A0A4R2IVH5_9ACTN|nr:DUF5302 domain-containing protein [Kribbella antiqua]TCO48228.1 hypothetical protein EV646_10445 [Kribbella antiqua]